MVLFCVCALHSCTQRVAGWLGLVCVGRARISTGKINMSVRGCSRTPRTEATVDAIDHACCSMSTTMEVACLVLRSVWRSREADERRALAFAHRISLRQSSSNACDELVFLVAVCGASGYKLRRRDWIAACDDVNPGLGNTGLMHRMFQWHLAEGYHPVSTHWGPNWWWLWW